MTTYSVYYSKPGLTGLACKDYDSEHYELQYDLQTGLVRILHRNDRSLKAIWPPNGYIYLDVNDE